MKSPNNILFLVSNYPSTVFPYRGIFFRRLACGLVKRGYNVTVLAPRPYSNVIIEKFKKSIRGNCKVPIFENDQGVEIYRPMYFRFPFSHQLHLTHYFLIGKLLLFSKINFYEFEIIDFRTSFPQYPLSRLAIWISGKFQIPFIYTVNGISSNLNSNSKPDYLNEFNNVVVKSAQTFAVSQKLISCIDQLFKQHSGLMIHPIDISSEVLNISKKDARKRLGLSESELLFLFVGHLTYEKGLDILIDSIKFLNELDFKVLVIGEGKKPINEEFKLEYLGRKFNEDVILYMRACDLFIFPSRNEGMPNVLKEAGACEIPIIASDAGGIPELLDFGNYGNVVNNINAQSLAFAIKNAVSEMPETLQKSVKFKRYIDNHYSMDNAIDQLISNYDRALEMKK